MQARQPRKLAVILHADVVGSTALVQKDETLAHDCIRDAFRRLSESILGYGGTTHELRGDALVAEFARASDAVCAALAFQAGNVESNATLGDKMRPQVRIGISLGEVLIADNTLTGAGVVLAQRVEQLAEPDGVCITGAVHEAVPKSLPVEYSDLGKRDTKGFDEPVQVYRVHATSGVPIALPETVGSARMRTGMLRWPWVAGVALGVLGLGGLSWWQPWVKTVDPKPFAQAAYPLPDRPSIAVLPFTNMSGDAQQEYFTDGITDDLITDLSKISGLFVIARNSVFTYKGRPIKIRQVARELGVRYVLEGSVRRAGNEVRINAQLIDATTEGHLWADRYDGAVTDVFELQDRVTQKIVAALAVKLTPEEKAQKASKHTTNPEAYDEFLEGWARYRQSTPEDFAKAIPHFQRAIELDPEYSRAHAALAAVYVESWRSWSSFWLGIGWQPALQQAEHHVKAAMKDPTPLAHRVASLLHMIERRTEEATAEAERAIALDPNDPSGYDAMARVLIYFGRPAESLEYIEIAQRLDPQTNYLLRIAEAKFQMEEFDEVVKTLRRYSRHNAFDVEPYMYLAAAYGHLGRQDEAKSTFVQCNQLLQKLMRDHNRWCRIESVEGLLINERTRELIQEGLVDGGIGSEPPEIIESSMDGIWLRKTSPPSPIQDVYDFANEHCRRFGKKSSLMHSSPPDYRFGCH